MRDEPFLDTNILIYAFTKGDDRSARAEALLERGGVMGVQVLNEFTSVAMRKLRWNWDRLERSLGVIEELLGPPQPLTNAVRARGVACARRHGLSFYDALIVGAAQECGCRVLASEDFQHGRRFGDLLVSNPFREGPQRRDG